MRTGVDLQRSSGRGTSGAMQLTIRRFAMRYQTYIAAVILGISPVAAFAAEADQQQPYATPQASDSEQNSSNTTTGDQQSDTYSAGEEGKHTTGQASTANTRESAP